MYAELAVKACCRFVCLVWLVKFSVWAVVKLSLCMDSSVLMKHDVESCMLCCRKRKQRHLHYGIFQHS